MQGSENRSQTPPQGGVVIPPQTVAQSNATKAARKKTMAQLPVYRAACNLLYVIVIITKRCPKSIRKFTDQIIYDCTELIQAHQLHGCRILEILLCAGTLRNHTHKTHSQTCKY